MENLIKEPKYLKVFTFSNELSSIAFKMLTGKPTGKIPLGRPRRRWEDNYIIMDH